MPVQFSDTSILNLMRLTSPSLPIGAFAYSQGLEFACDQEWVKDEESVLDWISGLLRNTQSFLDIPILVRLYDAWQTDSIDQIQSWNKLLLACRESKELKDEDQYLGKALAKLLVDLNISEAVDIARSNNIAYATAFSLAAVKWNVIKEDCCTGYLWAWCENQVNAAIKLIPLGQTAGQRILSSLIDEIPACIETGISLENDEIGNTAIGLGIASANHETQYTRLFRS